MLRMFLCRKHVLEHVCCYGWVVAAARVAAIDLAKTWFTA